MSQNTTPSTSSEAWKKLEHARKLFENDQKEDARHIVLQLAEHEKENALLLENIGIFAAHLDENICELNVFGRAAKLQPENPRLLNFHAEALMKNGYYPQAIAVFGEAIRLKPDMVEPYINLAAIQMNLQEYKAVVQLTEKVLALKPSEASVYPMLTLSLCMLGRQDEALKHANKFLKLEPKHAHSHHLLGRVYLELGRSDEAIKSLEKAIELDPTFGESYGELLNSRKFSKADFKLIERAEKTLTQPLTPKARYSIHFFLGKVYDDCKEWNKAFDHFRKGNLLHKPTVDPVPDYSIFEKILKLYTPDLFEKFQPIGHPTEKPVFVVGMPRSGTTLIEQIIAAHPKGDGAGELTAIYDIERQFFQAKTPREYHKQLLENLTVEKLSPHIETYLAILQRNRESAERIVDKMPDNFFYLGLIHLMFPKARIIHTIRNPLDTCMSCYFQQFTQLPWSYDLGWIARRYRFYRFAMDYWHATLPSGTLIDVEYETLTQDPEQQTRRIINHIGLPWDDSCLNFHEQKRAISTASLWQARQPIYTSSRKRWVNYAPHLIDLAQPLVDFLSQDDIDEFAKQGIKLKKKWKLFG